MSAAVGPAAGRGVQPDRAGFRPDRAGFRPDRAGFHSALVARSWVDGLITGNGTQGALVYGSPERHVVTVAHERLVLPLHPPQDPPDLAAILPELRAAILAGAPQSAADRMAEAAAEEGYTELRWTDPLIPGAVLSFTPATLQEPTGYRREVDFTTGEASVAWTDEGTRYRIRVFVSRADDVVAVELAAHPGTLDGVLRLGLPTGDDATSDEPAPEASIGYARRAHATGEATTGEAATGAAPGGSTALLWLRVRYDRPEGTEPSGALAVATASAEAPAGAATVSTVPDLAGAVRVAGAGRVLVRLRLRPVRSGDAAGPAGSDGVAAEARRLEALPGGFDELLARHVPGHRDLYSRVYVDLGGAAEHTLPSEDLISSPGDPASPALVEKAFDAGRYAIISSTGEIPPVLQGVWQGDWQPAWSCDYTMNGNVQSGSIAGLLPTGTPELLLPYFDLLEGFADDFRRNAARLLGTRGFLLPTRCSVSHGLTNHFSAQYPQTFWTAGGGWAARFFFDYWSVTGDERFLATRAYPFAREVARCYEDFLRAGEGAGPLRFVPSYSPENASPSTGSQACADATMDLAVARDLFGNLIRAARRLDVDHADVARWRRLLDRLPPYRVNADGLLAEWLDPAVADDYGHRHASQLYPLWYEPDPAFEEVRLRRAARALIERKLAWRVTPGTDEMAFGLVQVGLAAASLGDSVSAYRCVESLVTRYWNTNMVSTHNERSIFNVDVCGGLPALVCAMLAGSVPGVVYLLPALPAAWPRGRVGGLRCRGGVTLTDLAWEPGRLTVTLRATARADRPYPDRLALALPWSSSRVETSAGSWWPDPDDPARAWLQLADEPVTVRAEDPAGAADD